MTAEKILSNQLWDLTEDQTKKILYAMQEYARIKCLEAIKNTRHKACEVVEQLYDPYTPDYNWSEPLTRDIQNIPNQDVMPEL